jgi:hypothetical protein
MSRKTREAWVETPKGYATYCDEVGELLTVFWHERRRGREMERGWKFVCSGAWSQYAYPTVFAAIDAAETEWLDETRDRSDVVDVPPALRSAGAFGRSQHAREEAAQRAQQTHYERTFGDAWRRRQQQEAPRQAPPHQPYRPSWVVTLELTGNGPWSVADIRSQYRKLAMKYHPDRGGDVAKMAAVNAAYESAMASVRS